MTRRLVHLSDAEFSAIPSKVVPRTVRLADPELQGPKAAQWIVDGYAEKLLVKNAGLRDLFARCGGRLGHPDCRAALTPGQHLLHTLTVLDGQVRNGGLAQFSGTAPSWC